MLYNYIDSKKNKRIASEVNGVVIGKFLKNQVLL